MKKILILFILLLPIVHAIGLSIPSQRELFFAPNTSVSISYSIGNTDPSPLNARVTINAGLLNPFIVERDKAIEIPGFGTQSFTLSLKFPPELKEGLYPISVEVSEYSAGGGMAGLTGVTDTINVISPFEQGHPYGKLDLNQYQKPGNPVVFAVNIQNIGKNYLDKIGAQITLSLNGEALKRKLLSQDIPALGPFGKTRIMDNIDTEGLEPGIYYLEMSFSDQKLKQEIALGQPTISVKNIPPLKAAVLNDFTATVSLDNWKTKIENANLRFHVNQLLDAPQKITLKPGPNELRISAQANIGKSGTYRGRVEVIGNLVRSLGDFTVPVEGSKGAGKTGFKQTLAELEQDEPEQEMPAASSQGKSKTLLIVLLVASFMLFSFALGQYFARRKVNNNEQIPQQIPQPPKPQ